MRAPTHWKELAKLFNGELETKYFRWQRHKKRQDDWQVLLDRHGRRHSSGIIIVVTKQDCSAMLASKSDNDTSDSTWHERVPDIVMADVLHVKLAREVMYLFRPLCSLPTFSHNNIRAWTMSWLCTFWTLRFLLFFLWAHTHESHTHESGWCDHGRADAVGIESLNLLEGVFDLRAYIAVYWWNSIMIELTEPSIAFQRRIATCHIALYAVPFLVETLIRLRSGVRFCCWFGPTRLLAKSRSNRRRRESMHGVHLYRFNCYYIDQKLNVMMGLADLATQRKDTRGCVRNQTACPSLCSCIISQMKYIYI